MVQKSPLTKLHSDGIATPIREKKWLKMLEAATGKVVEAERPPRTALLAIDCSDSMDGEGKMAQARAGATDFAQSALRRGYAIGLIRFGSNAECILSPTQDMSLFKMRADGLRTGGSTDMAAAIRLAVHLLQLRLGERVVCLVTDGMPGSVPDALSAAAKAKKEGIEIMAVGTQDADKAFLQHLVTQRDLSVTVPSKQLQQGINSLAKMLPGN